MASILAESITSQVMESILAVSTFSGSLMNLYDKNIQYVVCFLQLRHWPHRTYCYSTALGMYTASATYRPNLQGTTRQSLTRLAVPP
jgi:hypothetical protein